MTNIYLYWRMIFSFNINDHKKVPIKNKHKRYHYYKKDGKWKPKKKFETYIAAEKYIKSTNKTNEYTIYLCQYCGHYHIGHKNDILGENC